jgi:hypothetical protein
MLYGPHWFSEQRQHGSVADPLGREHPPRERPGPHQAQQSQQAEDPRRLQRGRQERRREDHDRQVERVVAQPASAIRDHSQHDYDLGDERQPDRPVERDADRMPRFLLVGVLQEDRGDREQREDQPREF